MWNIFWEGGIRNLVVVKLTKRLNLELLLFINYSFFELFELVIISTGNFLLISVLLLFSPSVVSGSLWPHGRQHARLPCPSPTPGVCSNSCPLSRWYHPTISSSVVSFSFCPQSFPASESFPVSQLFESGGQSIGASAAASVLLMSVQGWQQYDYLIYSSRHRLCRNITSQGFLITKVYFSLHMDWQEVLAYMVEVLPSGPHGRLAAEEESLDSNQQKLSNQEAVRRCDIPAWILLPSTSFKVSEILSVMSDSLRSHGLYSPWNSSGQNTGVGSLFLLQGIFPTQGPNPGLLHYRQILYQLSHKGSLVSRPHPVARKAENY